MLKIPKRLLTGKIPHHQYEPPDDKRYASRHESSPDFEKSAEEIVTMHEKMYREATKNGASWLGGSENVI